MFLEGAKITEEGWYTFPVIGAVSKGECVPIILVVCRGDDDYNDWIAEHYNDDSYVKACATPYAPDIQGKFFKDIIFTKKFIEQATKEGLLKQLQDWFLRKVYDPSDGVKHGVEDLFKITSMTAGSWKSEPVIPITIKRETDLDKYMREISTK